MVNTALDFIVQKYNLNPNGSQPIEIPNIGQEQLASLFANHDYAYHPIAKRNHVKHALLAYTSSYGITPFFIVGADAVRQPGIIRDKFRSWFWVKT